MESFWFILIITLSSIFALKSLLNLIQFTTKRRKLPPGPFTIPILSSIQWLSKSFPDLEAILRNLRPKYGPIITLQIGHGNAIFIATHDLAHLALVQNGAIFSDRPPAPPTTQIISSNEHNISSAMYGPFWRRLRRNLTYQILNSSRIKSYSPARKWVMELLKKNLKSGSESGEPVVVVDHFQFAMFCLLVLMCFGDKLDEKKIREVEDVQRSLLLSFSKFNMLNFLPRIGKILFKNRWSEFYKLRSDQERVLVPLIRSRQEKAQKYLNDDEKKEKEEEFVVAYVDTLLNLELQPEEGGRKLNEGEIVSLCSEFLNAGTDTTSTALQWIMANLVKNQEIQSKVFDEIRGVVKPEDEIREEDLQKMPYLKAVILEGLRRHPPAHFVLPHAVAHDFSLNGYDIPKDATVNFMVAEMGWDPKVWEDPMEFKPERFLINGSDGKGEVFDITGSREIKMMPFGAGRRICPGLGLALLHLEYFVASLVRDFEWRAVEGDGVDLSEKQQFTVVMKNPLKAHISPRAYQSAMVADILEASSESRDRLDTQEAAENKYKKCENKSSLGENTYDADKKLTKNIECNVGEYNKMKEADPEFYGDASSSLQYGKAPKIAEDKICKMVKEPHDKDEEDMIYKMVKELLDKDEKRKAFSRRRKFDEEKDIDSINDHNENFNKIIERAYGKYTQEIKNNRVGAGLSTFCIGVAVLNCIRVSIQ